MQDIFVNIVSDVIWAILGGILFYLFKNLFQIVPLRRLWRIRDHQNFTICVSTSSLVDTGQYERPSTGIGQLRGLAIITSSLSKAYSINARNVLLSADQLKEHIEGDLILLGGPENNRITRSFLDKINEMSLIDQAENVIYWKCSSDPEVFKPVVLNNKVIKDYGMVIRMYNPFSQSKNTLYLLAGTHTYGTIAAARFLTENMYSEYLWWKKVSNNFVAVISCEIMDGWPVSIHRERFHSF